MTGAECISAISQASNIEPPDPVRYWAFNARSKAVRLSSQTAKGQNKINRGDMKNVVRIGWGAGIVIALGACATNDQGQAVIDTNQVNAVIGKLLTPPPANSDGNSGSSGGNSNSSSSADNSDSDYQPAANDKYVVVASDQDVEVSGGNTYIWATDPNGHRHRVLYGHGDQRAQLLARRAQLQRVVARNGGTLPTHAGIVKNSGAGAQSVAQKGKQPNTPAASTHVGAVPVIAKVAAPGKATPAAPAPAKPTAARQPEKKTTS
jgi:hypothetical protein